MQRALAALLLLAGAHAPAGAAPTSAIDQREAGVIPAPPYGTAITLTLAEVMAKAAREETTRLGFPGSTIAIVAPDGSLVLFQKMDGTTYVSIQFALAKARTAAISRRPTGPAPDGSMTVPMPDLIALPGGMPIVVNGRTIGGIGISGTEGGDVAIAKAALAAIKTAADRPD
jgi:glc operon protein GlcG